MAYARNLDTWDPMAESYHDSNINSYERGPGVNLTPYARPPANADYKLYVSNIPAEMTEEGLRQLFQCYGTPLGVISPPEAAWAFVTYSSFREAETAIRELNDTEPLHLTVAFARKKEKESHRRNPIQVGIPNIESISHVAAPPVLDNPRREYISPEQRPQPSRLPVLNLGRGKALSALARSMIASPPGHLYHENDDLLYPVIHDPNIYDPYEDAGPYPDTNNMWARGRLQTSHDGTRYVTMGRGYTWYELPNQHPRVNQQIRAVYENREAGLYEYGENKLAQQIGKCQNCARPATMRCQRCREFYCSRLCQENDWPRHKIECQSIPNLEGVPDSASISISSGEEVPLPTRRSVRRLRRPLTTPAPLSAPDCTSTPVLGTSPTHEMSVKIPADRLKLREKENEPLHSQDNLKRNHSGNQKPIFDQGRTANTGVWNPMKNGGDNQSLHSRDNQGPSMMPRLNSSNGLPPPIVKEDDAAKKAANKSSPQNSVDMRSTRSQNANCSSSKIVEAQQQPSDKMNRNFFKRANPQQKNYQPVTDQVKKITVNDNETAKPVPEPLLPDPDFNFYKITDQPKTSDTRSRKVSFQEQKRNAAPGTSGTQAAAKEVGNGMSKAPVQIEDKPEAMNPTAASTLLPKANVQGKENIVEGKENIVELLEVKEEGCFEVHILLGGEKAAVTVCVLKYEAEYEKLMNKLTPVCEKVPKPPLFKPKVGDFVCGKRLDDWIRGTVVSLGPPIRLAAADEGRIEPVTDLTPIPEGFINIPMLGAICELTKADFRLEPMERYPFMVVNKNSANIVNDGLEIVLYSSDEKEARGFLKPWTPAPEQKGIPYATLTSGTEVHVASFRSHTLIFVRSLAPEALGVFRRMTQDVARCSTEAPKLKEPPVTGEMVIAKYAEDGNFYRAIVRKITGKMVTVSYVDYGNIETTTLDNIRSISPKLKEYPSCAAKIALKDVPKDVAITKEVNDYLAMLAGVEKPLMCTFEGSPSVDGVVLKTADGTSVNKKVIELLTPSWKKEEDKTTVFMVEDLDVAELGTVGQTINVLALFSYGPLMHAMAPQDIELIEHVTGVMAAQMEEYCKHVKENYIPRQSELCLAPYEGQWYRAVCLEPNTSPTTSSVNFIDFGNIEEIPHTDLRVITRDFMTTKTLASVCQVVGLGPVDEDGELPAAIGARVTELVPVNGVTLIKIVRRTKPGEYIVELPEIRETLVKEGLLKL